MRHRWLKYCVVLCGAGVLLSLLSAWVCALAPVPAVAPGRNAALTMPNCTTGPGNFRNTITTVERAHWFGGAEVYMSVHRRGTGDPGIAERVPAWVESMYTLPDLDERVSIRSMAFGFPVLGLGVDIHPNATRWVKWGFRVPAPTWYRKYAFPYGRVLPLRPLWPGAAINFAAWTAFAAGAWACGLGCAALLKRLRIPAGACPRCRYDLRSVPVPGCPECGWGRITADASSNNPL